MIACILVKTLVGSEYDVAKSIRAMETGGVKLEVIVTYGAYDIAVRVEAQDLKQLDRIVTGIRMLDKVRETVTLIGTLPG